MSEHAVDRRPFLAGGAAGAGARWRLGSKRGSALRQQ